MMYNDKKMAGALIIFASAQFLMLLVVAEALYPGFDISKNYISELGIAVGPSAPVFNSAVFIFGLALVACAYFVHRVFRYRLLLIFLVLTGVGAMCVGVFNMHHVVPHSIAALIAFIFGPLSAIISHKLQEPPLSYASVVLGGLSLVALLLFMVCARFGGCACLGIGRGGLEHMIVYPTMLWAIGFGGSLIGSKS
jgi:hypothetical membrane protein